MTTTLLQIKKWEPCEPGWEKLLTYLGKSEADEEELSIKTILQSNGIKDAVWALRAVNGKDNEIRLFAADVAESVLHIYENKYPDDDRPRKAIQAARDYANELIDDAALAAAWDVASDAAWDAERDAKRYAAWAVAKAAALAAARYAEEAAALAAARDVANAAAKAAAWAVAKAAAKAAARAAKWKETETILLKYLTPKP